MSRPTPTLPTLMKRATSPEPPKDDEHPSKRLARPSGKAQKSRERSISPPPLRRRRPPSTLVSASASKPEFPKTSAVEAGTIKIDDHLSFFSTKLKQATRPASILPRATPIIPHAEWTDLFQRSQHPNGRHFVIHQHDHPVAGTHYDLRLQISETSSVSWAIMYGLPGDVNSRRLNRNATETRVHCLWNHLIETASHSTGSMLIWDTGEYEVVPRQDLKDEPETSQSESEASENAVKLTETEKLRQAFKNHKIRLRLHGKRLPEGYSIYLRLTKENDTSAQPRKPVRKRRRLPPRGQQISSGSQSSDTNTIPDTPAKSNAGSHSDQEEEETTRLTNAYPGATNSVGSIHQRKWYLSIDRLNSGFVPMKDPETKRNIWMKKTPSHDERGTVLQFDPFYVRGREVERSVVTGRLAADILAEEGVVGFVPRGLWRPVLE